MESKIMIDIEDRGQPFILLDYKSSDDLRDKVFSRFLTRCGAFNLDEYGHPKKNPYSLILHVLFYDQEKQRLQAMIEVPSDESEIVG